MQHVLGRFEPYLYVLLRIVAGLLFALHGAQKLFGVLGGKQMPLISQFGLAGIIEFFGGLMIAAGFLTSWVAFLASGQMAVAYFQVHAPRGPWPILNGGELAALYCFLFLYIASRGTGPFGISRTKGRAR
jgi:putative oxidoreductase